jgi:hypothetical protein
MRTSTQLALATLIAVAVAISGCTEHPAPTAPPAGSAAKAARANDADDAVRSTAPLVMHKVDAGTTDPAITFRPRFNSEKDDPRHYVWLDTAARSNHRLFLFMPAARGVPSTYQRIGEEAARLGYHVIGLMYQDSVRLADVCGAINDDDSSAACFLDARLAIIHGGVTPAARLKVLVPDGIDNRLTKLLVHLASRYPEEGWSRFLVGQAPKWSHIAVGGHSQGGGQAAVIAKIRLVDRVVLFSAVPDSIGSNAPAWLATHVTPSNRYFGLAHDKDLFLPAITDGWNRLGMSVYGPAVSPESSPWPYFEGSHMLVTHVEPAIGGYAHMFSHHSTVNDAYVRLLNGVPVLRDAWDYLLVAPIRRQVFADEEEDGK